MVNGMLGRKIGMTQVFDDQGNVHPVTVLQAGPCVITQIKRASKDGYESAQIGLVEFVKGKNVSKAMQGHFDKHNLPPVKFMREVAIEAAEDGAKPPAEAAEGQAEAGSNGAAKVGDKVLVDIFNGEGYVVILKAKKPPRERRGFAGATTLDPLKAAKKAAAGKAKK